MSDEHWEDRITDEEHDTVVAALDKFRASSKSLDAQHELYEVLTSNGVMSEEADEIISLEVNNR